MKGFQLKKRLKLDLSDETGWQLNQVMPVKQFKYKWFNHKIKTRNDFDFDKNKDFVILPEIFAHLAEDLLIKNGISYAIFAQNGYVINSTNNAGGIQSARTGQPNSPVALPLQRSGKSLFGQGGQSQR